MWQIAIKPGKPLAFGEVSRGDGSSAWFIGLPGNPVSAFVTFLFAVRPVLLRLQGADRSGAPADRDARPTSPGRAPTGGASSCACVRNAGGGLELFPNQGSAVLTSTTWGDGLVDNPGGTTIAAGDTVRYLPFAELLT
jgi:molybdopterin molybdotransferase